MSNNDIIRAWKDEEYRRSLSKEEQAKLPDNPAGSWEELELDEQMMEALAGGLLSARGKFERSKPHVNISG
ncbi:mersacidin/lichenicidin family type 2 lantibiotic [Coleofasciculus sp. G2-EDA-02]|uniref:mersacidin/lichenicidin family type 2 lantibiotic n=1 Tax=Coleofasciculus sp. G2-EDA-02 TaxID=3069529 RepID=UPI0032F9867E